LSLSFLIACLFSSKSKRWNTKSSDSPPAKSPTVCLPFRNLACFYCSIAMSVACLRLFLLPYICTYTNFLLLENIGIIDKRLSHEPHTRLDDIHLTTPPTLIPRTPHDRQRAKKILHALLRRETFGGIMNGL